MAKAYIMALVKFTDKEKFMTDYGSKVADVFKFTRGGSISELNIAYETWGKINKDKSVEK